MQKALEELQSLQSTVPLRHWYSLKSQPVAQQLESALTHGLGVDVVSEHEFVGAMSAGAPVDRLLVNGTAKHNWLAEHRVSGLSVHFDSITEVRRLAALALALDWRVGLRCAIPGASGWNQFGMTATEACLAVELLREAGVSVRGLHFHLRTNVQRVEEYRDALEHVVCMADAAKIRPRYIDVGGGLPLVGESSFDGVPTDSYFRFGEFREWLASIPTRLTSVKEVWLENGRYLTAAAGVLVLTVLDKKTRGGETFLICDGGRVNHARMASVERHGILLAPERSGPLLRMSLCGPTCGAVDRLGSWMLPETVEPGDRVIWLTAGAYHIPLETRFSAGLAPVVWFPRHGNLQVIRNRESPVAWWAQWQRPLIGKRVIGR